MHNEHAIGALRRRRQRTRQETRSRARQNCSWRAHAVEDDEYLLLLREIFEDRLNHQVGFGGNCREICAGLNPGKCCGSFFGSELSQPLLHREATLNVVECLIEPRLTASVQMHLITMGSKVLSDAMSHVACANNGDTPDFRVLHSPPDCQPVPEARTVSYSAQP
jgi:hypothetical protein